MSTLHREWPTLTLVRPAKEKKLPAILSQDCDHCDGERYSYHSCRNRHCPKCQHDFAEDWLARQQDFLLPTPYFLLTFTLSSGLREIARSNQRAIYNLLFRASATATQELAQDQRFIGGQIGMISILHILRQAQDRLWGRDLNYHPHVHYLVPGGGLGVEGQSWLPSREDFLVHVKPLSILFQAKFRDAPGSNDQAASIAPTLSRPGL